MRQGLCQLVSCTPASSTQYVPKAPVSVAESESNGMKLQIPYKLKRAP